MDSTKYNKMDNYLETINRQYISFSKETEKKNNMVLNNVIELIVSKMCIEDKLFKKLYSEMYFGGSYYDGLKVGSPDEYDIDLKLKFPSSKETEICNIDEVEIHTSDKPGFVHLYLKKRNGFEKWCEFWQSYLDTNKVLSWMQGVLQKALNGFKKYSVWYIIEGKNGQKYYVKVSKQGPAYTLIITEDPESGKILMNIDLVLCFSFDGLRWPDKQFKQNLYPELDDFFVVPKCLKGVEDYGSRYWRLSFQKQERKLIHNTGQLKPALRLLKKMRDVLQHKQISSYCLKTVVLWEAEKLDKYFWFNNSLSFIFMHILIQYQKCLESKAVPYFWNDDYNLLSIVRGDINNINNRIRNIINDIDRNASENPAIILKYILTPAEGAALFPKEAAKESSWCTIL